MFGYCYHLVDVISHSMAQSYHISGVCCICKPSTYLEKQMFELKTKSFYWITNKSLWHLSKTSTIFKNILLFQKLFLLWHALHVVILGQTELFTLLQWVPLNGISLGLRKTDNINQMKPLTDTHFGSLTVLIPNRAEIS